MKNVKRVACIITGIIIVLFVISYFDRNNFENSMIEYIDKNYQDEDLLINIADC